MYQNHPLPHPYSTLSTLPRGKTVLMQKLNMHIQGIAAPRSTKDCRLCISALFETIEELRGTGFAPLQKLGKTLHNGREEVARMFRFTKNNGTTECFNRK